MLARRIIPCLDVAGGRVVKGVHFTSLRDAGDPVEQAARYDAEGADELVFLDISASPEARHTTLEMVGRVAESIFIPFTVGGGIRAVADAGAALRAGADKVSVNTAAVRDPSLVSRLAESFGSQCVVAAVDVKRIEGRLTVMVNGGRESTPREAVDWVRELRHQRGLAHGGGVDSHLVRPCPECGASVGDRANPAAHRERDEDGLGHTAHHVERGSPSLRTGGDVEEDELVGAVGVVACRLLDRIPRVPQRREVHALDDAALGHVETRNDAPR
jgi:hypothetical protein